MSGSERQPAPTNIPHAKSRRLGSQPPVYMVLAEGSMMRHGKRKARTTPHPHFTQPFNVQCLINCNVDIPLMSAPKRRLAPASRQTQSAPKRPTTARTFDIHAIPTPRPSTNKGDRVDAPLMEPRTPHKRVAAPQPGRPTKSGNRVNCFDTRQEKPSSGRTEVQYIDD